MQYYYFAREDWPEGAKHPKRVFLIEKGMNDPAPKSLVDPKNDEEIEVFRYYDEPPTITFKDPNREGYTGKYKKFMEKRREAQALRDSYGKSVPEIAKEIGLSYEKEYYNPYTEKKEKKTQFITSDTPTTAEWEQIPLEKRKLAEKYGFIPQKEFEAPAQGYERVKQIEEEDNENKIQDEEMEIVYIGKI